MTREEIEQKAEEYVSHLILSEQEEENYKLTFIDGAHSRDEEINLLKDILQSEQEQSQEHIIELQKELNKLRNPWISVEERLPGIHEDGLYHTSDYVFVKVTTEECFIAFLNWKHNWLGKDCDLRHPVTHWMPIPKSQKGK